MLEVVSVHNRSQSRGLNPRGASSTYEPIITVEKPRGPALVSHRQTAVAYRVLVDMIAGLLVGGFLGYWLDRWLGWTPYALIVGLVVGFAAGVNNAWRAIRVFSDQAAKGDGERLP